MSFSIEPLIAILEELINKVNRQQLNICISEELLESGIQNYDEESKAATISTIQNKLQFLNPDLNIEIILDFKKLPKDDLRKGFIQVHFVEPNITEYTLKKIVTDYGLPKMSTKEIKNGLMLLRSQTGLNLKYTGNIGPGICIIPIGTIILSLGDRQKEAKENMGTAIGLLTLHEVGHGFGLKHTMKNNKEVEMSNPPLIMDSKPAYSSTSAETSKIDFTDSQKSTFKLGLKKWLDK